MNWSALAKPALLAALYFAAWLRERGLLEAERAENVTAKLRAALDDIAMASEARNAVARDLGRHPERLRDDDGFKRRD